MTPFKFTIGDIECRSCNAQLLFNEEHTTAEIVRWVRSRNPESEYCYVLAHWRKTREGFDLIFCGGRPFEVDRDIFWKIAEWGQERLEDDMWNDSGI